MLVIFLLIVVLALPELAVIAGPLGLVIGIVAGIIQIYSHFWGQNEDSETIDFVGEQTSKTEPEQISPIPVIAGNIPNFPYLRNPNFTGRVDLLDRLHAALTSGQRAAFTQTHAITGLGGVGKTQLALEYAYRHKDDYDVLWWVRSEEPATLAADYNGLAAKLDLPEKTDPDQSVITEAVRTWLEKNESWLLVFDNAEDFEDLERYLPRVGSGHVIITSRNQTWGGVAEMLPVDVFSRDESVEFLLKRTKKIDEDAARALADALGNLPLALEQAGAYIEEAGISLADYLKRVQEEETKVLKRGKPTAYPYTVATTWEIAFQRVQEKSGAGADLLNLCAFLAPDNIPKSLLPSTVADDMVLDDAMAALKRYSLLNVADDTISVHRLVQTVTRDRLDEAGKKRWAEAAVQLVNGAFPFSAYDVPTWAVCSRLLPHALAASEHAERLGVATEATGRLLLNVGVYLDVRAEFNEAKSAYERALEIEERAYGPDHPEVARTVDNLGIVLRHMGDFEGAKECHERALKIREDVLGPNHPDVARTVNNLGIVLQEMGDFEGAKEHFERALKIKELVCSSDHPEVARTVDNLGIVLRDMGDFEGAKEHFERALEIEEHAYGPDHPEVAATVDNLGPVLRNLGDFEGAKKCHERALKIREDVLGPNHPEVARTVEGLGAVLHVMGVFEGAKEHFERALEIEEHVYGPDHPEVARTVGNLGLVLQDLGDFKCAKKCHERALEIFRNRLGEDHHHTAWARNNLADLEREN